MTDDRLSMTQLVVNIREKEEEKKEAAAVEWEPELTDDDVSKWMKWREGRSTEKFNAKSIKTASIKWMEEAEERLWVP